MIRTKFNGYSRDGRRLLYKGGGGGDSTTKQEIPKELKPLASRYTTMGINLSNQPYKPYGGQRFEDLNALQQGGVDAMADRAMNGSETMDNAEGSLNEMMAGGSNPYLDSMVRRAQDSVVSNFNTGAVNSGSFGNSGLQDQFAQNLGDTANQMYGQAYDGDQARRMQVIQMAPTFGNAAYEDASKLLGAGQILQDQGQQQRDFDYSQFEEKTNDPYKKLAAMAGIFGSNLGGTSVTESDGGGGK